MRDIPHLYDSVSLQHFAAADALHVLEPTHDHLEYPRWVEGVADEIGTGAQAGIDECITVSEFVWLGVAEPPADDVATEVAIRSLQVAFGDVNRHRGEAESLHFAETRDVVFVTDDSVAYEFARHRLGDDSVKDFCDVLVDAIHRGIVNAEQAADIAGRVTYAGRHLRRGRPRLPGATYFMEIA